MYYVLKLYNLRPQPMSNSHLIMVNLIMFITISKNAVSRLNLHLDQIIDHLHRAWGVLRINESEEITCNLILQKIWNTLDNRPSLDGHAEQYELINMTCHKYISTKFQFTLLSLPSLDTKHIRFDSCHYSPSPLPRYHIYNIMSLCNNCNVHPSRPQK